MTLTDVLLIVVIVFLALLFGYAISFRVRFVNPRQEKESEEHYRMMVKLEQAAQESAEMTRSHLANGNDLSIPLRVKQEKDDEG